MYKPSESSVGTVKIGNTLFVNGTPYVSCGVCGTVVKQFDGVKTVLAGRDKKHAEVKPYTVMVGHYIDASESEIVDGVECIKLKSIPMMHKVPACVVCWSRQQDQLAMKRDIEARGGKAGAVFFKD